MAGGIALPMALQLISGVPLKKVGSVFMEKLSATKRLDGGAGLGGLMQSVLTDGNLSSVMQNPMAGLTGAIQGQMTGITAQITAAFGGGPNALLGALTGSGGLTTALTQFQGAGDNLAGLTNGASGFFAMLGHDNLAQMAGGALPGAASMATVTAPLASPVLLGNINNTLPTVVSAVIAGTMTSEDAATWAQTQTATIAGITAASAGALAWGQSMQTMISTVSSVAGSLAVPPSFDAAGNRHQGAATPLQRVLSTIVKPGPRATMERSLEAQIAHTRHDPVDIAGMTSLEG